MSVVLDLAGPADDAGIRALVAREAMPGRIRLALTREPEFARGCMVTGDECRVLVARSAADDAIVGVATRSVRTVFLNGREQRIGYLGQLRIDERFRGRWLLSRGFSRLAAMDRDDPLPMYLASIVDGNPEAHGVLVDRPRRGFPAFREAASYCTLALPIRRGRRTRRDAGTAHAADSWIARAADADLPEIARFLRRAGARRQFHPVWTLETLRGLEPFGLAIEDIFVARRGGAIVGTMALWDQSAYKQTVIRGYAGWLRWIAPLCLPGIGEHVRSAYASLVCVADDHAAVFGRLLYRVYDAAAARGIDYLLIGLDARDPLLAAARRHRHYSYASRLYRVSWPDRPRPGDALDDRPAYVDIASL